MPFLFWSSPVQPADPGHGDGLVSSAVSCDGQPAILTVPRPVGSAPAFVDGRTYIAVELTGTTPDGTVTFDKVWHGQRDGLGSPVTCVDYDPASGLTFTAALVPTGRAG